MEYLEHLADSFTEMTETNTSTCAIPTATASPRLQGYIPDPRVTTLPTGVQNSPTLVPVMVVEYPYAT